MKKNMKARLLTVCIALCLLLSACAEKNNIQNTFKEDDTMSLNYTAFQVRNPQTNIMYYMNIKEDGNTAWNFQAPAGGGMSDYVAIKVLQGIVNKDAPRLLVDDSLVYYKDNSTVWKKIYEDMGYRFVEIKTLLEAITIFRSYLKGIITYKGYISVGGHFPEADMAAVLGALTDRLPVRANQATFMKSKYGLVSEDEILIEDTFGTDYDEPKKISGKLEKIKWSSSREVIDWGVENLLPYCNPHEYHNMCEESMDFMASKKMFYAYIDTAEEGHLEVFEKILSFFRDRNRSFPIWGWASTEDSGVVKMAEYGGILQCAGSSNLSFHDKMPAENLIFKHQTSFTPENTKLEKDKYYISFLAAENDAVRTVTALQHGAWNNPDRGKYPISWGFEAFLADVIPAVADYYYKSATPNDYFFSGGSSPMGFTDYDSLPLRAREDVIQKSAYYMQKTDQKYLDLYSSYGSFGQYDFEIYGDLARKAGIEALTYDEGTFGNKTFDLLGDTVILSRESYMHRDTNIESIRGYAGVLDAFMDKFELGVDENWKYLNATAEVEQFNDQDTALLSVNNKGFMLYKQDKKADYVNFKAIVAQKEIVQGSSGMVFRYTNPQNYYFFYIKDGSTAGLSKVIDGKETVLGEIDYNYIQETPAVMKIVAKADSIKCYIGENSKLVCDIKDDSIPTGNIGFSSTVDMYVQDAAPIFTSQSGQIINSILMRTIEANEPKPSFMCGVYTDIFSDNHDRVQWGSEPSYGGNISIGPTELKEVYDYFEKNYPNQFKFVRYDEWVSASRIANNAFIKEDAVAPTATSVEGLHKVIPDSMIQKLDLRVRVTENKAIDVKAAVLKWTVRKKSGVGQIDLAGRAESGVDIAFEAKNVDITQGIKDKLQAGDIVDFWVEGKDRAGNSFFATNNSQKEPLASFTIAKVGLNALPKKVQKDKLVKSSVSPFIIDKDIYKNWFVNVSEKSGNVTTTKKGLGNGYGLIFNILSNKEDFSAYYNRFINAEGYDGLSLWINSELEGLGIKIIDTNGNYCETSFTSIPKAWTPLYVSFRDGKTGKFDKSKIQKIEIKFDKKYLSENKKSCIMDNLMLVADSEVVDDENWVGWTGHTYNCSEDFVTIKTGESSLKAAYFKTDGDNQFVRLNGFWNVANKNKLKLYVNSFSDKVGLKLYDNKGKSIDLPIVNVKVGVWQMIEFDISKIKKAIDKSSITGVELCYKATWSGSDGIVYYDNIYFE